MNNSNVKINWILVLSISMFGLAHGILSLFGLVQGWEMTIWISLALLSVVILVIKVNSKIFLNGLLAGLGITLFTGLPQSLFLDTYLVANPQYAEDLDSERNYSLFILWFIPVFGSIYGSLIGFISLVPRFFQKSKS